MRILLSLGIAILYPVVVYFAVMTIVPRATAGNYPTYPACSRSTYNYSTRSYTSDPSCDDDFREYDSALRDYNDARKQDDDKNAVRAQLALGIALVTIIGAMFLRDVRELMAGLSVGAMVVVVVGTTVLLGSDGSDDLEVGNVMLILLVFVVLTAILYVTEKSLPSTKTPEITK